jgi:hypothetical protein
MVKIVKSTGNIGVGQMIDLSEVTKNRKLQIRNSVFDVITIDGCKIVTFNAIFFFVKVGS